MTRDQFAADYCERSGMTVREALGYGRLFLECHCDASNCRGWQAATRGNVSCDPNVTASELDRAIAWADAIAEG